MSKIYYGINQVVEVLKSQPVEKLILADNFSNERVTILAKKKGVKIEIIPRKVFITKFGQNSQGCAVEIREYKVFTLTDVLDEARKQKNPIVVLLDELNDPHNLGAILRSSDIFNVCGVIYKKHNSVSLNETVAKTSAGAINYVKCCEVSNLNQTIKTLKENKFWVIGLAGESKSDLTSIPRDVPLAIVVGSEGFGISRLVRENCDMLCKIPMLGHVNCLNASVSCGIVLYELRR